MINSIPLSAPIELINITPFNPLISKVQIKVCWVGDEANPNRSVITKETAKDLANSLPGSPIVGYYNEEKGDFEGHNKIIEIKNGQFKLKPTTQPYGFVDLGAKVWFQKFSDEGVEREYMVTEGWLWTGQFPECQRVIDQGNNQSMELDEENLNAYWSKDENGNREFFIINEAIMSKLCILGEDVKPAFAGAQITTPKIEFSLDEDFKQKMFSMMDEIKNILTEGGAPMVDDKTPVVEEPIVTEDPVIEEETIVEPTVEEESVVEPEEEVEETGDPAPAPEFEDQEDDDVCPECGKPLDECECKDEDKKEYNLDEIPEYTELCAAHSNLEAQHSALSTEYEALKTEVEELRNFKAGIEKKEKEEMIKRFYMLSEEDKKDVVDNIDTYSLDDIEAKLSILCVRNKVSFSLDEDNEQEPTVYNLTEGGANNSSVDVPDWVKAIQEVAKTL